MIDANGYPEGKVDSKAYKQPNHLEKLPESLRVRSGHGGSHTFITHEFVSAIAEDRMPEVNVWEAIAYTMPGIIAHQSALRGGESDAATQLYLRYASRLRALAAAQTSPEVARRIGQDRVHSSPSRGAGAG